jgi:hypothetical protein
MRVAFGIVVFLVLAIVWWWIQRAAMKHRNNGNEFSGDVNAM